MQKGGRDMSDEGREQQPDDVFGELPIETRMALENPHRRQILRALSGGDKTTSPIDLRDSGHVTCGVPCISYHLDALEGFGLVRREGSEPAGGSIRHYFSSLVTSNSLVQAVLKATEKSDGIAPAAS